MHCISLFTALRIVYLCVTALYIFFVDALPIYLLMQCPSLCCCIAHLCAGAALTLVGVTNSISKSRRDVPSFELQVKSARCC